MERSEAEVGELPDAYRRLFHPDRSQLIYQVQEIVQAESYVRGGIRLMPGATVLDVGANVGVAATFFAERGAAQIHCFEPIEPIRRILNQNVAGLSACVVHPFGLAAEIRRATFTYYPKADAMSSLHADPERDAALAEQCIRNVGFTAADAQAAVRGRYEPRAVECDLRTLSAVLADEAILEVDLLKIDVERAELEVLAGLEDGDWPRIRQLVAEVHDEQNRVEKMLDLVRSHGFSVTVEQDGAMAGTDVHMLYAYRERR